MKTKEKPPVVPFPEVLKNASPEVQAMILNRYFDSPSLYTLWEYFQHSFDEESMKVDISLDKEKCSLKLEVRLTGKHGLKGTEHMPVVHGFSIVVPIAGMWTLHTDGISPVTYLSDNFFHGYEK